MANRQQAMHKAEQKYQREAYDNMLQAYFLLPNKKPDPEEEKKKEEAKISPSKKAAQPPRPPSATVPRTVPPRPQSAANKNAHNMSIKEMMNNTNYKKQQQPKDNLNDFTPDAVQKYQFFTNLFNNSWIRWR